MNADVICLVKGLWEKQLFLPTEVTGWETLGYSDYNGYYVYVSQESNSDKWIRIL